MSPGDLVKIVYQVIVYPANLTSGMWTTETFSGVKMGNLANIKEGDVGLVVDCLIDNYGHRKHVVLLGDRFYILSPHWVIAIQETT